MSIHRAGSPSLVKDQLIAFRYFLKHYSEIQKLGFSFAEKRRLWKIARYTQVSLEGLRTLIDCVQTLNQNKVDGAFVECGVWRGGCAALMANGAKEYDRDIWLFDSFEGMPEGTDEDTDENSIRLSGGKNTGELKPVGTNVAPEEFVERLLYRSFKFPKERTHIEKGWFQDTLPKKKSEIGPIALLRIDGDFYESTKVCLEELYPQVVEGGIVIIDDYHTFVGCRKAFEEFAADEGKPEIVEISNNQGIWFKKSAA